MEVFIEIIVILLCFSSTFCIEESFCAGTGYGNLAEKNLGLRSAGFHYVYEHPLHTIWAANHRTTLPSGDSDTVNFEFKLVEQTLPTGATAQLNGWLLVQVKKIKGSFAALALWAATDTREPIGEFLNMTEAKGCANWKQAREILPCSAAPIDASINPNMFVFTNNTVIRNPNEDTVRIFWKMSSAHCNKPKKFRFYAAASTSDWKASTPEFAVQDGDKNKLGPVLFTTQWIEPRFFGAASPVYDKSSITCTTEMHSGNPVWLKKPSTWTLTEIPEPKWLLPRWKSDGTEDTKVATERATCKAAKDKYHHHGGRCRSKVTDNARTYAGLDVLPTCNHVVGNFDADDLKLFMSSFSDKIKDLEKYLKSQCECPEVPTPQEVKGLMSSRKFLSRFAWKKLQRQAFQNFQDNVEDDDNTPKDSRTSYLVIPGLPTHNGSFVSNNITDTKDIYIQIFGNGSFSTTTEDLDWLRVGVDENTNSDDSHIKCALQQNKNFSKFNDLGLCLDSTAGRIVYGVRQWHATALLLCTVVLVPIASYMARYHKGAIPITPTGAAYIPVRVWYIVHILIILPIICMYTTAMVSIRRQRTVLGYSLTYYAKFHRLAGTVLIVLIAFQILTGFLRPINMFYRRLAIWLHFILGLLINYGGLVICILTYRIPGSPTAFQPHVDAHLFNPIRKHIAPMILAFWGVVDIAYQAFISVHIIQFDKSVGVDRPYFPVIIPIIVDPRLQFDDEYDKERSFQKGTLTAYVIFSVFIYFLLCISMYYLNDDRAQGFGPMYCTHDADGNFFDPSEGGRVPSKRGYCT